MAPSAAMVSAGALTGCRNPSRPGSAPVRMPAVMKPNDPRASRAHSMAVGLETLRPAGAVVLVADAAVVIVTSWVASE